MELTIDHVDQSRENAKVRALAQRLGVQPLSTEGEDYRHVVFRMESGESYDIVELLTALLDRLDAATTGEAMPATDGWSA